MRDLENEVWYSQLQSHFTGTLHLKEPLSKHTYFRIGGPAALLAVPKGRQDLEKLKTAITLSGVPFFILGAGSNLLVSDLGFDGVVIKMGRFDLTIDREGSLIRTGASVSISTLLRRAAQEGWSGLEFLTGIPGSVGGAVVMNAGTHLGESQSRLRRVEVFDLAHGVKDGLAVFESEALQFEYRKNLFLEPSSVVLSADWEITSGDPAQTKEMIDSTLARRKATQPLEYPSCGSVFKNPKAAGLEAWQVIDRLALRGHRIGNAQISEKHCNWILNLGEAKAQDVRALIDLVKSRAKSELGIEMEEEVRMVGIHHRQ